MRHFLLFAAVACASVALCAATVTNNGDFTASGELLAVRQSEIDRINALGTSWTAGHSERFEGMPLSAARRLMGVKSVKSLPVKKVEVLANLPENFDAREQWGHWCESIAMAWDQGDCGSCWAVSTGGAITDRTCIASNGTVTPWLSYDEINSCDENSSGCDGGDPGSAVDYWVQNGVVTGGPYGNNSDNGAWCDNYQVAPCSHHVVGPLPPCSANEVSTPACTQQCQTNGGVWQQYKHFGATSYALPTDVPSIQSDLFQNGPQIAAFTVYSDFPSYKGGVYQLTPGATELGGHAVRLIGWGTDEASGLPYWLVMNSWNKSWGINGAFKILRGQDECGFEDSIVAGTAKLSTTPRFTATI